MDFKLAFTITLSKMIIGMCRMVNLGGTTLPGKVARKIYPDILKKTSQGFKTIVVTGTNGKTTTTRIIGRILEENSIEYISNRSGANLASGIISTFIDSVNLTGKSSISTALIEIDEAAFNAVSEYIQPDILVVTNFFRDQLDRYGELYSTIKGVKSGIDKLQNTKLVLNADDSLCASLGRNVDRTTIYYGIGSGQYNVSEEDASPDALFCTYCKGRYEYTYRIYGHLGWFKCPRCGYQRPHSHITCTGIRALNSANSRIQLSIDTPKGIKVYNDININLPGLYNIYNSLAATACSSMMGLPVESAIRALGSFKSGFGRMETINTEGKYIRIILVKNPAGFNQVINYLLSDNKKMQVAILINDKLADGTDISWLWDVEFEKLQGLQERAECFHISGTRAEDMALRLKYAGIDTGRIVVENNLNRLINTGLSGTRKGHSFYILPTYTAMLDIRKCLRSRFNLKEFWK